MLRLLRRVLRAGCPESALPDELEQVFTRHATLLVSAVSASLCGVVLVLIGSLFPGAMALLSGLACGLGLVASAMGHHRLGVLLALIIINNVTITVTVTAEGADQLAVLHIFAVCVPFSLFHTATFCSTSRRYSWIWTPARIAVSSTVKIVAARARHSDLIGSTTRLHRRRTAIASTCVALDLGCGPALPRAGPNARAPRRTIAQHCGELLRRRRTPLHPRMQRSMPGAPPPAHSAV